MQSWSRRPAALAVALVVGLMAASCSPPETPEEWTIERQTEDDSLVATVCRDVEALALGAIADEDELGPVVEELAPLAARLGSTDAVRALDRIASAHESPVPAVVDASTAEPTAEADDATPPPVDPLVELTIAARALDDASWQECGLPAFTALYAATSFADCHGELSLEVNQWIVAPDPDVARCDGEGIPAFLPCWGQVEGGYLAIDCRDGSVFRVVDGEWENADEPRPTTTTTTLAPVTTTTVDPLVRPDLDAPGCASIEALLVGDHPLQGGPDDVARLVAAVRPLGPSVDALVEEFRQASLDGAPLEEIEPIVLEIDTATVAACGVPVISASVALVGGVSVAPCWLPTGEAYPAYTPADCR